MLSYTHAKVLTVYINMRVCSTQTQSHSVSAVAVIWNHRPHLPIEELVCHRFPSFCTKVPIKGQRVLYGESAQCSRAQLGMETAGCCLETLTTWLPLICLRSVWFKILTRWMPKSSPFFLLFGSECLIWESFLFFLKPSTDNDKADLHNVTSNYWHAVCIPWILNIATWQTTSRRTKFTPNYQQIFDMHTQLLHLLPHHFQLSQTCNLSFSLSLLSFLAILPSFPHSPTPSLCESWLLQTFDLAALW